MNSLRITGIATVAVVAAFGSYLALRGEVPGPSTASPSPATSSRAVAETPNSSSRRGARPPRATAAGFDAEPGARFAYRIESTWRTSLREDLGARGSAMEWNIDGELPSGIVVRIDGTLDVLVLAKSDDAYLVRFGLVDAHGTQRHGPERSRVDPRLLRGPGFARMSREGKILGFAFDPEVPSRAREMQASLFAMTHQFVTGDDTEWFESGLRDGAGTFTARFEWAPARLLRNADDDVLRRTVLRYTDDTQESKKNRAEASFSDGWIERMRLRSDRVGTLGALSARVRTDVTLERTETSIAAVDLAEVPSDTEFGFAHADEDVVGEAFTNDPAPFHGDPVERFRELSAAIDSLAEAGSLDTQAGYDSWRALSDLVRQRPAEALPLIDERIRASGTPPGAMHWLTSALGRAGGEGSSAAVEALGGLISDDALPEDVRLAALIASHQVGSEASPELVAAVTDLLLRADLLPPGSALPNAASLLVGSLAENGALPFEPTLYEIIRDDAFGRGDPGTYFEALANSGRPNLADEIVPYLDDEDVEVREAAALALGDVDDPAAREALAEAAAGGDSPAVRRASIEALAQFPPTREATRTLAEIALTSDTPTLRAKALGSLGEYAAQGSRKAAEVLALSAEADADPANQRLARRVLADLSELGTEDGGS